MQVQICDVSKRFDGTRANLLYGGVSLAARSGGFICITGPSGCGKSTLLRMIAGFETPDTGQVLIDGKLVNGPHGRAVMVFQEGALFPWLNVRLNIEFGMRVAGKPNEECAAKSDEMLTR